jgi:hypothetical protein
MKQNPVYIETFEENIKRAEECKKYLQYNESIVCVSHGRLIYISKLLINVK